MSEPEKIIRWVKISDVMECLAELKERFDPSVLAQGNIDELAIDALSACSCVGVKPLYEAALKAAVAHYELDKSESTHDVWHSEYIKTQTIQSEFAKLYERQKEVRDGR